ncbi:protocadherin-15-like [Haliotis rufescens]|uniref:protocadherin-15-like n=1 Tax=Haliotis rufescens TaxID=6454 RepID=UPI00201F0472|nr:protocadherin-15-like [Haliotis rufescens]
MDVIFVVLVLMTTVLPTTESACAVNSTILSFNEEVPPGTMIMQIIREDGEKWAFREDGPEGYIGLSTDPRTVIFTFLKSPDLEEINNGTSTSSRRNSLPFTLECMFKGWKHIFKQEIVILDINDNDPYFRGGPFVTDMNEMTSIGSSVFNLRGKAVDPDITGMVSAFKILPYFDSRVDGSKFFTMSKSGQEVILQRKLDFDVMEDAETAYYMLNISVQDDGYPRPRLAFTTLKVFVVDADDQGPAFLYENCPLVDGYCATPSYEAIMESSFQGELSIWPGQIQARDRDSLNYTIAYSIIKVKPPSYEKHFIIDESEGKLQVTKPVHRPNIDTLHIVIKAEESSENRRFLTATLRIQLRARGNFFNNYHPDLRDIPINQKFSSDDVDITAGAKIPFSIFMSTVGVFLVIMCGMLIIFVKLARGKPTQDSPRSCVPQARKVSGDSASNMSYNSTDTATCVMFSSPEDDRDSTTSRNSSIELDFDDAISFAMPKSDAHVSSVSFTSQECGTYSPNSPKSNLKDTTAVSRFRKRVNELFSFQKCRKTKQKSRVRFDIRNVSNF